MQHFKLPRIRVVTPKFEQGHFWLKELKDRERRVQNAEEDRFQLIGS